MTISEDKRSWWGWGLEGGAAPEAAGLYDFLQKALDGPPDGGLPVPVLEEVELRPPVLHRDLEAALFEAVGAENVRTDRRTRVLHTYGRSYRDLVRLRTGRLSAPPDAVVYPGGHDEVRAVLDAAAKFHAAVVPFGGGSSVVGGVEMAPEIRPFISLDLTRLNRVLEVDRRNMTARIQAGMFGPDLEDALSKEGLTLGHFPQSFEFSTLGGWIAARGAGHKSNRYGKMEDLVVSARTALPFGELSLPVVPAAAAGGDPAGMIVGSEGVLGVITEAVVKVRLTAEATWFGAYLLPDFASGMKVVRELAARGASPATIRLSDEIETAALMSEAASRKTGALHRLVMDGIAPWYLKKRGVDISRACLLLVVGEGESSEIGGERRKAEKIIRSGGGVKAGTGPAMTWHETRYSSPYLRDDMIGRGYLVETLETAGTWTNLPVLYEAVRSALHKALGRVTIMTHLSHSYANGANLYFTFFARQEQGAEEEQWRRAKIAASEAIVRAGGALSHHHGVGRDHKPWFERFWGKEAAGVFRATKTRLDPLGVMNPGAVFDCEPDFPPDAGQFKTFSPAFRDRSIERLGEEEFDLLVVGGGIVGAGTAWDASLRGLSAALVEKIDFGAGTSGKSSRMIHGGLRYLKMLDLKLVRESLGERHRLIRMAPHLVKPTPHIVPIYKGEGDSQTVMHIGLWGYDALAGGKGLPAHHSISAAEALELEPTLKEEGLEGALVYYDALTDDARLTLETVKAAARAGATVTNHMEAVRLDPDQEGVGVTLRCALTGREIAARARTVVIAAGVWTDRLRTAADPDAQMRLRPAKGIHIVFPREIKPIDRVILMKGADGRPVFAVPSGRMIYAGTTDTDYEGDLDQPTAETKEVDYLIDAVNGTLRGTELTREAVTASWAGIRPLVAAKGKSQTKDISREHEIRVEHNRIVTVAGGKLTTFRVMAAQTVDQVLTILTGEAEPPCPTEDVSITGPARKPVAADAGLPGSVEKRIVEKYGPHAHSIFELNRSPELAAVLDEDLGITAAEVYWAVKGEMALTLTDAMVRRLGLTYMTPDNGEALAPKIAQQMARILEWTEDEVQRQLEDYREYVTRERSFKIGVA